MTELKPCPFCGSEHLDNNELCVRCLNCGAKGPKSNNNTIDPDGIDLWNTRQDHPAEKALSKLLIAIEQFDISFYALNDEGLKARNDFYENALREAREIVEECSNKEAFGDE